MRLLCVHHELFFCGGGGGFFRFWVLASMRQKRTCKGKGMGGIGGWGQGKGTGGQDGRRAGKSPTCLYFEVFQKKKKTLANDHSWIQNYMTMKTEKKTYNRQWGRPSKKQDIAVGKRVLTPSHLIVAPTNHPTTYRKVTIHVTSNRT